MLTGVLHMALPALALLVMAWSAVVAYAAQGEGELDARALARDPSGPGLTLSRTLHVMHLTSLSVTGGLAAASINWWNQSATVALLQVGLVCVLVWFAGDLIPRLLAALSPELVQPVRRMVATAAPAYRPLLWLAERMLRTEDEGGTPQPLAGEGPSPQEMARGVFSLSEMTVAEVMTPRLDVIAVDIASDEAEVVNTFRRSEHARILVIDDEPDTVIGIIYAKDFLPRLRQTTAEHWQTLIRPPLFVPEAKRLDRQLRDFQRGPGHLAVVVDEFGGTAGLITLEDILEQIVGEIQDEHDVDEALPLVQHADGHFTVQGGVALVDLEAELGHEFEREDVATVGGLVLAAFGRVPWGGEAIAIDGWRFVVDLIVRRRIQRVSVWAPSDETTPVAGEESAE